MPFKAVVLSRQAAQGEKKAATGNVLLVHVNVRAGVVQAKELAPKTRCNVIAPGMIKTGQSEFATTPTQLNSTVYQDTPQCAMKQKACGLAWVAHSIFKAAVGSGHRGRARNGG
jgi:hypothetical protein